MLISLDVKLELWLVGQYDKLQWMKRHENVGDRWFMPLGSYNPVEAR